MKRMMKRVLGAVLALGMAAVPAMGEWSGEIVLQAERALYASGYHGENCDEQMDEETTAALKAYQTANGLNVTGVPDEATMALLDAGTGVTCYEYLRAFAQEYADSPILQAGSSGDEVFRMQQRLMELGYFHAACDGIYGEETVAAVRRFQLANGLARTGTADMSVRMRLWEGVAVEWDAFLTAACATTGDSGNHVRMLQRMLKNIGCFRGECTGDYGEMTQQAVTVFQRINGLEINGIADYLTCERLYSGNAVAVRDKDTICAGHSGEAVAQLQRRLAELGYYARTVTGNYGSTTATAVRLFQMANGLTVTGEADPALQAMLDGECIPADAVYNSFRERTAVQDASVRASLGAIASRARGYGFDVTDGEAQEGFGFVQYACAAAGIPLLTAEDIMELLTEPVEDPATLVSGDVVRLLAERPDGVHSILAIASGDGRVVYATPASAWVLESDFESLNAYEIYRWNMKAAQQ